MSREESARAAVQALIPHDEILDMALTYPRGFTKSQAVGMAIGGAVGYGSDFQAIAAVGGAYAGGKIFSNLKELPQTFVLAISPTTVYVLGRDKQGVYGGWDTLQPMIKFDRSALHVELKQTLATLEITLTDTATEAPLELEAKRLGSLDVKALVELMMMSNEHLEDEEETPTSE